ncbi:hypothetical protein SZ64_09375 [Erythrobacter sp. SG61-1L]|nr:hypothetical protein SZ64_09375 [Erythrobacter sp. SG61-1L]
MDLTEVDRFDWLLPPALEHFVRKFGPVSIQIHFFPEVPPEAGNILVDSAGNEISKEEFLKSALSSIPYSENPEAIVDKTIPVKVKAEFSGWKMRDKEGRHWDFDFIEIATSYVTKKTVTPFTLHKYSGGGKDYDIASGEFPPTTLPGHIVAMRNEDHSISFHIVPDKVNQPGKK